MRLLVDVNKCVGAGQCVRAASTVFAQNDEDGLVVVLDESPSDELLAQVRNAARLCPARAIVVEETRLPAA
jgi:ferredoxin